MPSPILAIARLLAQRTHATWGHTVMSVAFGFMAAAMLFARSFASPGFDYCRLGVSSLLAGMIAFYGRQAVLDARQRLLPDGPRLHLLMLASLLVVYLAGLPTLLHIYWQVPYVALLATTSVVTACVFQFVLRLSWWSVIAPFVLYMAAFANSSALRTNVAAVVESVPTGWVLIGGSAIWLAILIRQLMRMTEESPGYQPIPMRTADWDGSPASTSEVASPWRDRRRAKWLSFAAPSVKRIESALGRPVGNSIWARCRRWRAVHQAKYPLLMLVPVGVLLSQAMSATTPMRGANASAWTLGLPTAMILFAMVQPVVMQAFQAHLRAGDLLKPVTREQFLREMGMSLAIDLLRGLGWGAALLTILMFVLARDLSSHITPLGIAYGVLFAVSGFICIYGSLVWFMRFRLLVVVALTMPAIVLPAVIITATLSDSPVALIGVAVAMATIGTALMLDAYRRWLLTDLA